MPRPTALPWDEPGWQARAEAWTRAELDRLELERRGEFELVRTRPWAAIGRVETAAGRVWFKEPAPALAFEARMTTLIAERCAEFSAEVLAADDSQLLTLDAGPRLHELFEAGADAPPWEEILPRYAETQLALTADAERLLSIGAPDKRPARLLDAYSQLVRDVPALERMSLTRERLVTLEPALAQLVDDVEDVVPATVIHEEVNEGNVFVRDGQPRLLDWGEGAISHPFAGMTNTLRDIAWRRELAPGSDDVLRLRDLYLEPWTAVAPAAELRAAFEPAYLLGMLCRAFTWMEIIGPKPDQARREYAHHAAVWLEFFRDGVENGVRLGAE